MDTVVSQLENWQVLTHSMCLGLGRSAYIVIGRVGHRCSVLSIGNWVGPVFVGGESRAPHIAHGKFGELVLAGAGLDGNRIMTPVVGNAQSFGWMGGGVAHKGVVVAVSKWKPEHDKLLALITLYNAVHGRLRLHHTGFRWETREQYNLECALFPDPLKRDADDHLRTYSLQRGGTYIESQYFPDGPHTRAQHWDLVCDEPYRFLDFIAAAFGQEPVYFDDAGQNDPKGVVWVKAETDGTELGVMARSDWWDVNAGV